MEVVILPGSKQVASLAADAVEALLRRKPDAVLGLALFATGVRTGGAWLDRRGPELLAQLAVNR